MPNQALIAIHEIMKKVKGVGNDIKIESSSMSYRTVSESAVLSAIRPFFIEYGLVYYPTNGTLSTSGAISFIGINLRIVHVESGDAIDVWSAGAGRDSQDKGPGKAITYATKYGLLKTLMIRGEDDPDQTSSEDLTKRDQQIKYLRDQAVNITKVLLSENVIGNPEHNLIMDNINDAVNDANAINRLEKAIGWLEKVKTGEIKYTIDTPKDN